MDCPTKYLSDKEKIRLKLLQDEIYMLTHRVKRILEKRDRLWGEVKIILEPTITK